MRDLMDKNGFYPFDLFLKKKKKMLPCFLQESHTEQTNLKMVYT